MKDEDTKQASSSDETFRRVEFQDILELKNIQNLRKGTLALTLMTPSQTIHALPILEDCSYHQFLTNAITKQIFEEKEVHPEYNCIEIRYTVRSENDKDVFIMLPRYITPKEYEQLSDIIEVTFQNGFDVSTLVMDIDPTERHGEVVKFIAECVHREILTYLIEKGAIKEYFLPYEEKMMAPPKERDKQF